MQVKRSLLDDALLRTFPLSLV